MIALGLALGIIVFANFYGITGMWPCIRVYLRGGLCREPEFLALVRLLSISAGGALVVGGVLWRWGGRPEWGVPAVVGFVLTIIGPIASVAGAAMAGVRTFGVYPDYARGYVIALSGEVLLIAGLLMLALDEYLQRHDLGGSET